MIPMVDLKRQYARLKKEIDQAVGNALEQTQFILGPNVSALETEIAAYHSLPYAVGCANGTDALLLALRASGIGPGDEVITNALHLHRHRGSGRACGRQTGFCRYLPGHL